MKKSITRMTWLGILTGGVFGVAVGIAFAVITGDIGLLMAILVFGAFGLVLPPLLDVVDQKFAKWDAQRKKKAAVTKIGKAA